MTHWTAKKLSAYFWAGEGYGFWVQPIVYRVFSFFLQKKKAFSAYKSFSGLVVIPENIQNKDILDWTLSSDSPEIFFSIILSFNLFFLAFLTSSLFGIVSDLPGQVWVPGVLLDIFWICAFQYLFGICLFNRIWSLVFFHLCHGWSMIIHWVILCLELLKLWKTVKLMGNI